MIRKITQDGFFFGMPWNQALGHLARKDRPLIVFVFTNEFDNAYSRVYTETFTRLYGTGTYKVNWEYNNLEVVAFPTITDEQTLSFVVNVKSRLNSTQQPPDPHCVQLFRQGNIGTKFSEYLGKISVEYKQTT